MVIRLEADLQNKSLLKLRKILEEYGLPFVQGTSKPDVIKAILDHQETLAAAAPTAVPTPTKTPAATPTPTPRPTGGMVSVTCGSYQQSFNIAGKTVGQARSELRDAVNVRSSMKARVGGMSVDDKQVLQPGDDLEFVKPSGDKA